MSDLTSLGMALILLAGASTAASSPQIEFRRGDVNGVGVTDTGVVITSPWGAQELADAELIGVQPNPLTARMRTLLEDIRSRDFFTRSAARRKLQSAVKSGAIEAAERPAVVEILVNILREDFEHFQDDMPGHPHETAIEALGLLRAPEAAPVMVEKIDQFRHFGIVMERLPLIGHVLISIGEPAIPPILERAGTASEREWHIMRGVLSGIDRKSPLARQAMQTLLDAQRQLPPPLNDEEKAERELIEKRLTEFLKTPEPRRPKPEPGPTAQLNV